jgi:hypothetical protein
VCLNKSLDIEIIERNKRKVVNAINLEENNYPLRLVDIG